MTREISEVEAETLEAVTDRLNGYDVLTAKHRAELLAWLRKSPDYEPSRFRPCVYVGVGPGRQITLRLSTTTWCRLWETARQS